MSESRGKEKIAFWWWVCLL